MLVCCQPEGALVHFRNFPQASLKIAPWLILYSTILHKHHEMMLAIFTNVPTKIVNVTVKSEGTGGLKGIAQESFDLVFVLIEAHAVDCVLQAGIFATSTDISVSQIWTSRLTQRDCHCLSALT